MIYNLLLPYMDGNGFLNIFRYLTFRGGMAIITSLIISFALMPYFIKWVKRKQAGGQPIRECGPESHMAKAGTPTMGGAMILFSLTISTLLWADLTNQFIWIVLFVTSGFGLIGFIDDYKKVTKRTSDGIKGKLRVVIEALICIIALTWLTNISNPELAYSLSIPFFKKLFFDLGVFYIMFGLLVIIGSANAVNLTDGLDGLAIVPIIIAVACLGFIAYLVGNFVYANYLGIYYLKGAGELSIFALALIGSGLGFLWFNAPPAKIFMGDTGSLACGSALGITSVIIKHEIIFAIIGGLFVVEALSVIAQVISFKMTGKRIFKMAPIHHHFEKKGWSESTVVMRFWIVAIILAIIGLSSLKLR